MYTTFLLPEDFDPAVHYSRGTIKIDNCPQQMSAPSFCAFAKQVLSDRSLEKGLTYICGPLSVGPHAKKPEIYPGDNTWRITERVLARNFLPFDVDGVDSPETFEKLISFLQKNVKGFAYTTASHTAEKPRCRFVLAQSRPTSREEGIKVCKAIEDAISHIIGPGKIKFDDGVYRAETALYTPLEGAETWIFNGCYVDVDGALEVATAAKNLLNDSVAGQPNLASVNVDFQPGSAKPNLDREAVIQVLQMLPDEAVDDYRQWLKVGMALHHQFDGSDEGLEIWVVWSKQSVKYKLTNFQEKWRSFVAKRTSKVTTFGSVMKMAKKNKPKEYGALFSDNKNAGWNGIGVELIRASDIEPENINWIWSGWLAHGKFHILAGKPGAGKTTIALSLAATISKGGAFPDGSTCEPGYVLIWSGEDDPADTLVPRLRAMGADCDRVLFVGNIRDSSGSVVYFNPATHMKQLEEELKRIGNVKLVICDPIVSAIKGDSHKNTEVRRDLDPLVALAKSTQCAVLGITHVTKGTQGKDPQDQVTGSLAFVAVARIVLMAGPLSESMGGGKVLCRVKSNVAVDSGGYKYLVTEKILPKPHTDIKATSVEWGSLVEGDASKLLAGPDARTGLVTAMQEAKNFLMGRLSFGERLATDISEAAYGAGISESTLNRAKRELGVVSKRKKHGDGMCSFWSLPAHRSQDNQPASIGNVEQLDHLDNVDNVDNVDENDMVKNDNEMHDLMTAEPIDYG